MGELEKNNRHDQRE